MAINRQDDGSYPLITCDAPGCGREAPPADEIMKGRGLNNMGWACWGGTHLCPDHVDADKVRELEAARIAGEAR